MIDIADLKARIEQHLSAFEHQMDANAAGCVRQFADWLDSRQAEEAQAAERIEWLTAHGYTVTKN